MTLKQIISDRLIAVNAKNLYLSWKQVNQSRNGEISQRTRRQDLSQKKMHKDQMSTLNEHSLKLKLKVDMDKKLGKVKLSELKRENEQKPIQ